jgi:hypothetical protein
VDGDGDDGLGDGMREHSRDEGRHEEEKWKHSSPT